MTDCVALRLPTTVADFPSRRSDSKEVWPLRLTACVREIPQRNHSCHRGFFQPVPHLPHLHVAGALVEPSSAALRHCVPSV